MRASKKSVRTSQFKQRVEELRNSTLGLTFENGEDFRHFDCVGAMNDFLSTISMVVLLNMPIDDLVEHFIKKYSQKKHYEPFLTL